MSLLVASSVTYLVWHKFQQIDFMNIASNRLN